LGMAPGTDFPHLVLTVVVVVAVCYSFKVPFLLTALLALAAVLLELLVLYLVERRGEGRG